MSYTALPTITRESVAGNEFIPARQIFTTKDIADCVRTRTRFSHIIECGDRIADIDPDLFSDMSNKFIIRSSSLNDAYVAAIYLSDILSEKIEDCGEYLLFSEAPVSPSNPIALAEIASADAEELSRIFNRTNPIIHVINNSSGFTVPDEKLLTNRPEFYLCCENVKESRSSVYSGLFDVSIGSECDMTPLELMETIIYSNDYNASYIEDELSKLAKKLKKADELTVMKVVSQIISNHILSGNDDSDLIPDDLKGVSIPSSVSPGAAKSRMGDELVGLSKEIAALNRIVNSLAFRKDRIKGDFSTTFEGCHMIFAGPPGTAKTTLARIFAKRLAELGIIKNADSFRECRKSDIVGQFVGHTAKNVDEMFRTMDENGGGILFFDEIYSIAEKDSSGFDTEAVTCIVQNMENYRHSVFCIFAGYYDKMRDFLNANPGLESRVTTTIQFSGYDDDTLCDIFEKIAKNDNFSIPSSCRTVLEDYFKKLRASRKDHFGNGREARNLFINATAQHSANYTEIKNPSKKYFTTLSYDDILSASESILSNELTDASSMNTIGFRKED